MGGAGVGEFTVTVTGREVVAAALPLQEHWLPLSNLDLLLPPLDVGVFFCYANNTKWTFSHKVGVLKKALREALVSFYALAGEVVENGAGEPEILCNNRGVEFLEASAMDVELRELNLYEPDSGVGGKLVPEKKHGVFSVQSTKLKCGGMVVGCTFDHRVSDAYSANMFFVSWARIATASTITAAGPSFRRSLLNPRHPLSYHPSIDNTYVPLSTMPLPPSATSGSPAMVSRIYHLSATRLSKLQSLATKHTNKKQASKLRTLSAYLWKLLAQHASQLFDAAAVLSHNTCKLGIVVDGRQRLGTDMASYFGNVLSIPFASLGVEELTKLPLSDIVEVLDQFIACTATKEHFVDLVDWVEAHRPEPAVAKVYIEGTAEGPAFVVSSGRRFPVAEVDFGWGEPVFGSYHFPWGGSTGYVMPMPNPCGNSGDWIVYMHLFEAQLDFIEEKASHVFKPFRLNLVSYSK